MDNFNTLYTLTACGPDGRTMASEDRTFRGAISLALVLLAHGWHNFTIMPMFDEPVPDGWLTPCAQPGAVTWRCGACGKLAGDEEGTTDHPELCDDCWAARFASEVA